MKSGDSKGCRIFTPNSDAIMFTAFIIFNSLSNFEFITSLNEQTPMVFEAATKKMKVNPGDYYTVNFYAENNTDKKLIAQAIPSIAPGAAAEFLKKTECFCFSEQEFKPGEKKNMPVRFIVNPELPERYKTITLAYTFFDITDKRVS